MECTFFIRSLARSREIRSFARFAAVRILLTTLAATPATAASTTTTAPTAPVTARSAAFGCGAVAALVLNCRRVTRGRRRH
jgi:hypothetical protein